MPRLPRRYYGDVTMIGDRYFTAHDGSEDHVYREIKRARSGWRFKARGAQLLAVEVGVHEAPVEPSPAELRCTFCRKFKLRHADGCPLSDDLGPWAATDLLPQLSSESEH